MKTLTLSLIACLVITFSSCKKEDISPKDQLPQNVTYEVTGTNIIVRMKDKKGDRIQHIVTSGIWRYEFQNTQLDTAFLIVSLGDNAPSQTMIARIKINGEIVQGLDKTYRAVEDRMDLDTLRYGLKSILTTQ